MLRKCTPLKRDDKLCTTKQSVLDDKSTRSVGRLTDYKTRFRGYTIFRAMYYPKSFYLLGKIYEKKGDKKLAIDIYEKFLDLWKDADKDLPDLIDAKARLTALKGTSFK